MPSLGIEDLSTNTKSKDPFYFPPPKIEEKLQGHEIAVHLMKDKLFDLFVIFLYESLDMFKENLLKVKKYIYKK